MKKKVSRSRRVIRNWCVVVMMALVLWVLDRFPPLTKDGLAKAILGDHLMEQGEIIWEETDWDGHDTMYLLSGNTVIRTPYFRSLIRYFRWESDILYGHDGVTCIPSRSEPGEFLVMGRLHEAAAAVLELQIGRGGYQEKDRAYTAEGVWKNEKVIVFAVPETYEGDADFFANMLRKVSYQEEYYDYTLTLYDSSGQIVGVWTNRTQQNPISE